MDQNLEFKTKNLVTKSTKNTCFIKINYNAHGSEPRVQNQKFGKILISENLQTKPQRCHNVPAKYAVLPKSAGNRRAECETLRKHEKYQLCNALNEDELRERKGRRGHSRPSAGNSVRPGAVLRTAFNKVVLEFFQQEEENGVLLGLWNKLVSSQKRLEKWILPLEVCSQSE